MKRFVNSKHGVSDGDRPADMPKVPMTPEYLKSLRPDVPKTTMGQPLPNTGQSRANNAQQRQRSIAVRGENRGHSQAMAPPGLHQPKGQDKRFFDTDAESVSDATAVGTKQSHADPAHEQPDGTGHQASPRQEASSDEVSGSEEEEEGEGKDDGEFPEMEQLMRGRIKLNAKQHDILEVVNHFREAGRHLPHISGADSYPSTSAGHPSETNDAEVMQPAQNQSQRSVRRQSSKDQQAQAPAQSRSAAPAGDRHQHPTTKQSVPFSPSVIDRSSVDEINTQLALGQTQGKSQKPTTSQHRPPPQQSKPQQTWSGGPISVSSGQRGSAAVVEQHLKPVTRHKQPIVEPEAAQQPQVHHAGPKRRKSAPVSQSPIEKLEEKEQPLANHDQRVTTTLHPVTQPEQLQEPLMALDYPELQLFQMAYQDIKTADFDHDPNQSFAVPAVQSGESLENKLCGVATLQSRDQASFFATLPIDEWEEAGDWFLERFADAIKELKRARQEKRQFAREFEMEVERRHKTVTKKRKQTEEALTEMRGSGAKVLQSTPKKMRMMK